MRVSLNPQFLNYDPVCDSGINVGYNNHEQAVGVGESKKELSGIRIAVRQSSL